MGWAIVSVVGFALITCLVVALARDHTARWERDRRAAEAAAPPPVPTRPQRAAARLHAGLARRAPRLERLAHLPHGRVALHLPHVPHLPVRLPHLPVRRPHLPRRRRRSTGR
jgi:hypothetical protein